MGIVYVAHLESGTLTRQTAWAEGRHTALMSDFGQRISLVHELRKSIGAEERIDDRRDSLCIDKVNRSEHLIVAHIHALADSARHARQAHAKLVVELLAHRTHTTVGEVVDIVNVALRIDKLDKILDNRDDILTGKHLDIHRSVKLKFLIDSVAAHLTKIITLVGEEEVLYHLACRLLIGSLRIAELTIDIEHCITLIVGGVLAECVIDNA